MTRITRPGKGRVLCYIILALFVLSCLTSCYTRQKATNQFSRATVAYPELPADYCARIYPPKEKLIKGDTVIQFDTLYTGGETFFDTIVIKDTIRIIKTIQLAGTKIIEKYFIHDTLQVVNSAAVDLCRIETDKAINIAADKTKEADKWRRIAKKRFWIIAGLGFLIAIGVISRFRKKIGNTILLKK